MRKGSCGAAFCVFADAALIKRRWWCRRRQRKRREVYSGANAELSSVLGGRALSQSGTAEEEDLFKANAVN